MFPKCTEIALDFFKDSINLNNSWAALDAMYFWGEYTPLLSAGLYFQKNVQFGSKEFEDTIKHFRMYLKIA
jgi:hypothetical protein